MNVKEIGSAFLLSAEMPTLIRRFRDERLGRIMAGETPVFVGTGAKTVVHLIPFTSMGVDAEIDLAAVKKSPPLPDGYIGINNGRFNFDGYVTFSGPGQGPQFSYTQAFRSGASLPHEALSFISTYPIDRDTLLLPDVLVRDYDTPLKTLLRPAFDTLWQTMGLSQSPSEDETGD